MFGILDNLSTRKRNGLIQSIIGTVAQIIILVLILPGVIIILNKFFPEFTKRVIIDTLDKIPFIEVLVNYYKQHQITNVNQSFKLFEFIVVELNNSIMSMYIVGLIVNICKSLSSIIRIKGLPVFQTVLGVFLSTIALTLLGDNFELNIIASAVLIIIASLLSVVVSKNKIITFLISMLEIAFSVITAGTMCAYLTVIVLIAKGGFDTYLLALEAFIWSIAMVLICLLIDYLLFGRKKV